MTTDEVVKHMRTDAVLTLIEMYDGFIKPPTRKSFNWWWPKFCIIIGLAELVVGVRTLMHQHWSSAAIYLGVSVVWVFNYHTGVKGFKRDQENSNKWIAERDKELRKLAKIDPANPRVQHIINEEP